ncbi:hypothetical protein V6N12_059955 [Hibiscus sabdariffa]|uniref:Uncharacterized protein n=1 Tax=Hibiscus sabdariffa TaxID=183260 RepID=A0ABR2D3E8_9ROSI
MTLPSKFVANLSHWSTLFPYILWSLWKRRNATVFQVHSEYRDSIYAHSLHMVEIGFCDTSQTRSAVANLPTAERHVVWCKSLHGWCKLNFDGAV